MSLFIHWKKSNRRQSLILVNNTASNGKKESHCTLFSTKDHKTINEERNGAVVFIDYHAHIAEYTSCARLKTVITGAWFLNLTTLACSWKRRCFLQWFDTACCRRASPVNWTDSDHKTDLAAQQRSNKSRKCAPRYNGFFELFLHRFEARTDGLVVSLNRKITRAKNNRYARGKAEAWYTVIVNVFCCP